MTFAEFVRLASAVVSADFIAYATRSATVEKQKARLIIPLKRPVPGEQYVIFQKILNTKLDAVGIVTDPATERSGQVCYLPNPGEFYAYHHERDSRVFCAESWAAEIEKEQQLQQGAQEALKIQHGGALARCQARIASGQVSPVDAFNDKFPLPILFEQYGYVRKGNRWLSPNSSSGTAGVIIANDGRKWLSSHGSDSDIGCPTKSGTMGDAFDLFVSFEHDGNKAAAHRAAKKLLNLDIATLHWDRQLDKRSTQEIFEAATAMFKAIEDNDKTFDFSQFALNGTAAEMEAKMLADKFILGRMAILGQSTAIYAKPNAGKTLLTLWLLTQSIKTGNINGKDVFYITADDNHKGLTFKLKLAEKYGFQMLAPGYKNFKSEMLAGYLATMVAQDGARGKILILDTVKKFTDIMRKDKSSAFGESIRQFGAHGGSVIMLAHVNKNRDDDGKLIYSGTSDLVDDADCAYMLDVIVDDKSFGIRTVKFENIKSRGDVALEASYKYDSRANTTYYNRLVSVCAVSDEESDQAEKQRQRDVMLERNLEAVEAIRECLREGASKKTELIKQVAERSGISKQNVKRALLDHTGNNPVEHQYWQLDIKDKNAHVYVLNTGVLGLGVENWKTG
jgi:hypothetical protein